MSDLFDLSLIDDALNGDYGGYDNTPSPTDTFDVGSVLDTLGQVPSATDMFGGYDNTPAPADTFNIGSVLPTPAPAQVSNSTGALGKIVQGLGLAGRDGKVDLSNPKVLDSWMKVLLGGANALYALSGGYKKPTGYKTPAEVRASLNNQYSNFSPTQQSWSDKYFNTPVNPAARPTVTAASLPSPVVGRAQGGALHSVHAAYASGGHPGYVHGDTSGQEDTVNAVLAPGEYVWDADVVSALGDGNNAAGAKALDEMRQNIRAHKRSADITSIPPKAKPAHEYLPKGALSIMKGAR